MKKQKKRRLSLMRKRMIAGYLFILPWLVGFIIIYVRSLFQTVEFSFSKLEMDTLNGGYTLTKMGWENFRYAFLEHGGRRAVNYVFQLVYGDDVKQEIPGKSSRSCHLLPAGNSWLRSYCRCDGYECQNDAGRRKRPGGRGSSGCGSFHGIQH